MKKRHVLLVGDYGHRDFADAVGWLSDHCRLTRRHSVDAARSWLHDERPPDVMVFAQSRPGQLSQREIERLHAVSPLSRLVALLGSWCEGETRTGRPWHGLLRIYWHQWRPRMSIELLEVAISGYCVLGMQRTATASEQYERLAESVFPQRQGLVAIHTQTFQMYEALSDACDQGGLATVWIPPASPARSSGAAAAIWDGISAASYEIGLLEEVVEQHTPAPVIALMDFVRGDDRDRALAAGASFAVAKPFLTNELLWQLDQAIGEAGHQSAVSHAA